MCENCEKLKKEIEELEKEIRELRGKLSIVIEVAPSETHYHYNEQAPTVPVVPSNPIWGTPVITS